MSSIQKKMLLIRMFLLFALFCFPVEVFATINVNVTCPKPVPGKRYAVFAVTSDADYPPSGVIQKCVLLNQGETSVPFSALVSSGLAGQGWGVGGGERDVATGQLVNVYFQKRHHCGNVNTRSQSNFENSDINGSALPKGLIQDAGFVYNVESTTGYTQCPNTERDNAVAQAEVNWRNERYYLSISDQNTAIANRERRYIYPLGFYDSQQNNTAVVAVDCSKFGSALECGPNPTCFWVNNACNSKTDRTICPSLNPENCAFSQACEWDRTSNRCISRLENQLGNQNAKPEGYKGPITDCAFKGTCRDLNDLLDLGIQIAKYLFGFLGTVALGFFVYGGFLITASMGNSEKVSEGKGVLVAAVMGIIVCFAAYAAVNFLLDLLQVGSEFRIIGN